MTKKQIKILFMHGLESQPGGGKDIYLRKNFSEVCTPNMQMSLYRITRKNSVIRNALRLPLFFAWLFFMVIVVIFIVFLANIWLCFLGTFIFVATFLMIKNTLIRQGLLKSLYTCVEIQTKAIKKFAPDIIVGSSWGAFIALFCAGKQLCNTPMLLIAPPTKLIIDKINQQQIWESIYKIPQSILDKSIIVHGDKDAIVPIEDSRELIQKMAIRLEVIADGDHSLNNALVNQNMFSKFISQVYINVN